MWKYQHDDIILARIINIYAGFACISAIVPIFLSKIMPVVHTYLGVCTLMMFLFFSGHIYFLCFDLGYASDLGLVAVQSNHG